LNAFTAVFAKECVDNARDRRAMSTALLMPLMGPFTLWLMFLALSDAHEKRTTPRVPVQGRENAPVMIAEFERSGMTIVEAPADPVAAVKRGDVDVVVVVPAEFGDDLRAGRTAAVELIVDQSRQSSSATVARVRTALANYGQRLGALRLIARGVDPGVLQPLNVAVHDVGTAQARASLLLASLPLFLLLGCFVGSTYIAVDATAGERERGSLEALLMNPVPARVLIAAKLAATSLFSVVGVVVSAAGFVVAVRVIPFADTGLDLRLSAATATGLVVLLLPVAVLGAAVQLFVGTLSRTFKTAQAAISFVSIAPTIPGALLAVFPQQPTASLLAVPTVGHTLLVNRLLRGEPVAAVDVVIAVASVVVCTGVVFAATTRLFGPRLVAGR
jgi:sodium transport system permease protein